VSVLPPHIYIRQQKESPYRRKSLKGKEKEKIPSFSLLPMMKFK